MKILMVIDSLDKGGKERRMLELIKGLKKHGNQFDIYLLSLTNRVEYKYVYDLPIKFEILRRNFKKDPTIILKLKKIISDFGPDIIHSWSTMASVYISISNLFSGIPLINAVLADAPLHLNIFNKHFFRVKLTTPFSNLIVSNSKAGITAYKTPVSKSVCIYNGIDFSRFDNLRSVKDVRKEIIGDKTGDIFVIVMVASFDERKDFKTLVNAAIKMCFKNPAYTFILIGNGPTLEKLRNKVPVELMNECRIIFTGERDDVESILQIADLGVLMTNAENHGEGISNTIIEYMSMGKPVLASRGGGTDEVVKDNYNGYLIDPGNEDQLMGKIESLFNNRTLLDSLGDQARKYARANFGLEEKTAEYIELYRNLAPDTYRMPS
ncbi:MAG TPA: glycosyltransferase [Puia sp.]|nr:glycosyltransferase [Puia sp.]